MDNDHPFWYSSFLPQYTQASASVPNPQPLHIVSAPAPLDLIQTSETQHLQVPPQPIGAGNQQGNSNQWGPRPTQGYHNYFAHYNQVNVPNLALLASQDAEINALRESQAYLKARVALLEENERALQEKNKTFDLVLDNSNARNDGFSQKMGMMCDENDRLLKENVKLQQEVNRFKEQFRKEKEKCKSVASARDFLKNIQLKLIAQKQELAGKVAGLEEEVKTLKEKLAQSEQGLQAKVEELKSERERVEELKGEREELADIAKVYESEKGELKKACLVLEAEKEELTKEADELQKENQNLGKDIKKLGDQNWTLKQTVESLGEKAERLSRENKVLNQEMGGMNDKNDAEISKIKELMNCSKLDLFTAKMRVENLQTENKQLKEQLERGNKRARKTARELDVIRSESDNI